MRRFCREKNDEKRETQQLHSRRGEALGVPDRLRRQARGICHGDLWSKRGNRDCTTDTCTWLKKIYFTTLMLVEEKVFSLFCKLWSVSGQDQSRLREKHWAKEAFNLPCPPSQNYTPASLSPRGESGLHLVETEMAAEGHRKTAFSMRKHFQPLSDGYFHIFTFSFL